MCRDIYYKELAHIIMETEKFQALHQASRRQRRAKEDLSISRAERTLQLTSRQTQELRNANVSVQVQRLENTKWLLRRISSLSLFDLFRPSADWTRLPC